MVARRSVDDAEKLVMQTFKKADNSKEVLEIWREHSKIKRDLNKDAMDEINPYLEQGV